MKKRVFLTFLSWLVLLVSISFSTRAQSNLADVSVAPIRVNLRGYNPLTLDPAMSSDTTSSSYIEQLFAGLVDIDDTTGAVAPELAESWTVSADATVYTFTLRTDAFWSDGTPITAQDAHYGILRSLDPTTTGPYSLLYIIKNAEPFHTGAISDPNAVGIAALDTHTLRITLEHPAAFALSIFANPAARPLPKWAIDAHGADWIQPGNIVTSGAYRLTEWVPNDHITLEKSGHYFNTAQVQIEQVNYTITDDNTAWQMYLDDQIDTIGVPLSVTLDPIQRQAMRIAPNPCTFYFGFNVNKQPFDNPLVRQAFASALDRLGIVYRVLKGVHAPALTFTPPGVFGHVDGELEGIGLPYDPQRAQQLLAQAGYPAGQGFPAITLTVFENTAAEAIANDAITAWQSVLGVTLTLETKPWYPDYLDYVEGGNAQMWYMGWCSDYPDANNFLYDAVVSHNTRFGGWENPMYRAWLDQAIRTTDPIQRAELYKQAETILVETDAVMAPVYYSSSVTLTKARLERTFPTATSADIADWRIKTVSASISPSSEGTLTSFDGETVIQVPASAFTDTVILSQEPTFAILPAGELKSAGQAFEINAVSSSDPVQTVQLQAGSVLSITLIVDPAEARTIVEGTVALSIWNGSQWVTLPTQPEVTGVSALGTRAERLIAVTDRLGVFRLVGETNRVYLPFTRR